MNQRWNSLCIQQKIQMHKIEIRIDIVVHTLTVRSGGKAQTTALCIEARFLADRLPASRSTEPNLRARSIMSFWSESQALDSSNRSNERSRERVDESERSRNDSNRWSMWSSFETLGLGLRRWSGIDEQGRFAMDGQWRKRVSISGGGEREWEERGWVFCVVRNQSQDLEVRT